MIAKLLELSANKNSLIHITKPQSCLAPKIENQKMQTCNSLKPYKVQFCPEFSIEQEGSQKKNSN